MSELDDIELEAEDFNSSVVPIKKVPHGDLFEAARAGDADRLKYLLESGVNVNARDPWDSVALYYACLVGHLEIARILLENGAICSEHTFDGDRCHYAALNLKVRKLLKAFEARPPPLGPLQTALRDTFLGCAANQLKKENEVVIDGSLLSGSVSNGGPVSSHFPPDIVLYVQGRPIEAHRVVLSARSPFFRKKFETEWKNRTEIRLSKEKLSYIALYSLIHFFYSDRLEIGVEDMENLARICKVCKCHSLQKLLEKELTHQRYADYKALKDIDDSQKRFILQGISLPEEDRLAASLHRMLQVSLSNSVKEHHSSSMINHLQSLMAEMQVSSVEDDLADMYVVVDKKIFRCHQVVLASRSDYFKARLLHVKDSPKDGLDMHSMPCLIEHDLSMECFEKMIEYMYTDKLEAIDPDQAEEMFDAASRYLLFPLNRAVADALLPHLEMVSPAEICHWLLLSDLYSVSKIREYCLDMMACNFETFADTPEFRAMLLTLPPPSGNSEFRTTVPSAPGAEFSAGGDNLLDDLREKWLEAEGAELDERDDSALLFDKRLEMLMVVAKNEKLSMTDDALESTVPADVS